MQHNTYTCIHTHVAHTAQSHTHIAAYPITMILQEVKDTRVYSVKFYHLLTGTCGLGLLTRNWKFYSISDLDGSIRVRRMAEIPGREYRRQIPVIGMC